MSNFVSIHQDIFNFERKRKGFTGKQLKAIAAAAAIAISSAVLCFDVLKLPIHIASVIFILPALPTLVVGFLPIYYMSFDEAVERWLMLNARGDVIVSRGETVAVPKGELSRVFLKKAKKKGFECQ